RTTGLAFVFGFAAQWLKVLRTLLPVSFFLSLAGVLALRRILAPRPEPPRETPALPARPRGWRRFGGGLPVVAGISGSVACSLALLDKFAESLFTVLVVGPLALVALGLGADLFRGWSFALPRATAESRRNGRWLLLILAVGFLFRFGATGWFP